MMQTSDVDEEAVRQIPSPLPAPEEEVLSAEQWGILSAIADAVIPSFTPCQGNRLLQYPLQTEIYERQALYLERLAKKQHDPGLVASYLSENATAQATFRLSVLRLLAWHVHDQARKDIKFVLNTLNTRAGSLLLTGYTTPLDCLPVHTREQVLQKWGTSRLPFLRQLHGSLTQLVKVTWLRTSPTLGRLLSYPRTPVHGNAPSAIFPFKFLQIPPSSTEEPETLETDVVIVGSGCGGAVAAKVLAEAGLRVIVVEKSYYWPPDHLPMSENEAAHHLFTAGAALQSDDNSIAVVAGSTWGGGGTVNWSASLQTQGFVRREWSQKFGLQHFTSAEYQADLDAVCERMGVGTAAIEHNKANRVLLEGARKLGWSAKVAPQNTGGEAHNCGYCTLGCGSCGKKGPTETFLPDAAKSGASFLEGFEVHRVLFSDAHDVDARVATAVKGTWTSRDSEGGTSGRSRTTREVIIRAQRVVISTGALATPLLLLRSGLSNPHTGRHLHVHPCSFLGAAWKEEVRPWEGPILTSVVSEFENLDGEGYGAKLEATVMVPGMFLPMMPWKGGLQFKEFAANFKHMTGYISLARDRYAGHVYPDPIDGRCRIQYSLSRHDKKHILEGLIGLANIAYVEGARELHTPIPGLDPFVRPSSDPNTKITVTGGDAPSVNDAHFQAWLTRLRNTGFPSPDSGFASAHQMGTCRMSTSPRDGVVDPKGRVWGTEGLYVCNTSVFPSASGVNPMITCMGISRGIARGIVEDVRSRKYEAVVNAKL